MRALEWVMVVAALLLLVYFFSILIRGTWYRYHMPEDTKVAKSSRRTK